MARVLFWILLVLAVQVGWRLLRRRRRQNEDLRARPGESLEPMVACAVCGVFVPRSGGVESAGRWYCSPAHRDQTQPGQAGFKASDQ